MVNPEVSDAIKDFVRAVSELEPLWREHLAVNGEPLPHVFFGDVSRFAVQVSESGDENLRLRFTSAIERLAASDNPDVVNLIHVAFAENLVWGAEDELRALADLRRAFGPATLLRIAEFEEWAAEAARDDPPPGSS